MGVVDVVDGYGYIKNCAVVFEQRNNLKERVPRILAIFG